jgi:alkylation response protein AidB-like acyl-CoA dehydrogenase
VVTAIAAVALGIARGAIDAFVELAEVKAVGAGRLRDQPSVQAQVGQAEAQLRAARASLYATVGEVWAEVLAAGPTTPAQQHLLNLAAAHATAAAAQVVDLMWGAAGSSSIVAGHPLERRFRDIHVVTQHNAVGPAVIAAAGRMFLGLDETAPPPRAYA